MYALLAELRNARPELEISTDNIQPAKKRLMEHKESESKRPNKIRVRISLKKKLIDKEVQKNKRKENLQSINFFYSEQNVWSGYSSDSGSGHEANHTIPALSSPQSTQTPTPSLYSSFTTRRPSFSPPLNRRPSLIPGKDYTTVSRPSMFPPTASSLELLRSQAELQRARVTQMRKSRFRAAPRNSFEYERDLEQQRQQLNKEFALFQEWFDSFSNQVSNSYLPH